MKSPVRLIRTIFPVLVIILAASFAAQAQEEYAAVSKWESFNFADKTITTAEINPLAIEDLKLVRGIVFGKHGRVFKDFDSAKAYVLKRREELRRDWEAAHPAPKARTLTNTV